MITYRIIERPRRRAIIKRAVKANNYLEFNKELGYDVWNQLTNLESLLDEHISIWLPKPLIKAGTSGYAVGIIVSKEYDGIVPNGFEIIDLEASKYLMIRIDNFNNYYSALNEFNEFIASFDIKQLDHKWNKNNPKIELEPINDREIIQLIPIDSPKLASL